MNNNNINFKDLWLGQPTPELPNADLIKKARTFKKLAYRKIIFTSILLSATSLFICWIWIKYNPQLWTTKLGIVLTILSMAIYAFSINQQYPILKKIDADNSNATYLKSLLELKKKQQFIQTTVLNLYFILLSLGIFLYMIEPVSKMKVLWGILAYAVTAIWILFNWFYLRPKQIKKQQTKINEIIRKFEDVQVQLNDE